MAPNMSVADSARAALALFAHLAQQTAREARRRALGVLATPFSEALRREEAPGGLAVGLAQGLAAAAMSVGLGGGAPAGDDDTYEHHGKLDDISIVLCRVVH